MGKTIFKAYLKTFLFIAVLGFISESLMGVAFYLTSFLIQNLVDGNIEEGLYYCTGFACCVILIVLLRFRYQVTNAALFVQIREGLSGLLYKKSLKLGLRSISE